jgi:hypothetical protein
MRFRIEIPLGALSRDALGSQAEPGLSSLQHFDVALAGLGETMKRSEDANGSFAVQAPDVSASAFGPGDFLHA